MMSTHNNLASKKMDNKQNMIQDLKEGSVEIRWLLHDLRAIFSPAHRDFVSRDRIFQLLDRLYYQTHRYFQLQEACGLFESTVADAPELAQAAAKLKAQHVDLARLAEELVARAKELCLEDGSPAKMSELGKQFFKFDYLLQQHEICEDDLLFDAANSGNLGMGD